MNKLIKLLDNHYIIVSDSEIKQNDIVCEKLLTGKWELFTIQTLNDIDANNQFKVTYSTQPLETKRCRCRYGSILRGFHPCRKECQHPPGLGYNKIKQLSLSEVEEVVYGYNYHTLAKEACIKYGIEIDFVHPYTLFIEGFKAHQEISKDKLFTIEDIALAFRKGIEHGINPKKINTTEYIKSLLPKTEWDVEFDEQGKIKLI